LNLRKEGGTFSSQSTPGGALAGVPVFSILHSSARPDQWRKVYEAWISQAYDASRVQYVLCVDPRWGFTRENLDWMPVREGLNRIVENHGRRCYVDGVNEAARVSSGHILIVNADDQYPCENWDERLLEVIGARVPRPSSPGYVVEVSTGTKDEHARGIMVMPILSRARYQRLGYVFYPQYESMYADNDFCEHARADQVVIDARSLLFPHRHPSIDFSVPMDEQYHAQNREQAYELGVRLLTWRRRISFGKELEAAAGIQGWMFPDELECLSLWASQMQSVVEIGSWKGRSTYAIAKGTAGKVYAVDTFLGSPDEPEHAQLLGPFANSFEYFRANVSACPNVEPHVSDSVAAAADLPEVDMVFIDGGHSYEQVKADLEAWLPKTRRMISGHDIEHPPVARAVNDVLGPVERGVGSLWFKPVQKKRTIALCLSGERFEGDWLDSILTLYAHLIELEYQVWRLRSYTSNVYVTREELRHTLVGLAPAPDLVLWIDDDNIVTPAQFDQLAADLEQNPETDGVTAWCWIHDKDKRKFTVSCGEWSPDHIHWMPFGSDFVRSRELRPVEVTGFPCFLMRYSAIEKAGERAFLPVLDRRLAHGLAGEDIGFCLAAEKGGATFLADPRVMVPHLKYVSCEPILPDEGAPAPVKVACMMRVKNEGRWIRRSIESVKALCGDRIFVMEDGSTDNTVQEIEATGARYLLSPFVGQGLDERRDKNWLLDWVKSECAPDWILCIDGDEELEPGGAQKILRVLEANPAVDCFALRFLVLWNSFDTIRVDKRYSEMVRQSLFRPLKGLEFRSYYEGTGSNHVGLHTSNAPQMVSAPLNVFLLHYGYVFREDRIRKYNWIVALDPTNADEDFYRHTVQGDLPEFPADAVFKWGGPLELRKLPARLVPTFPVEPRPALASGSAVTRALEELRAVMCGPVVEDAQSQSLRFLRSESLRLNLGCSDRRIPGYLGVDVSASAPAADVVADLRKAWPWADGSVAEVVAHDVIEHLPEKIHTMNELYRVLAPGAIADIVVPTTEGPGAFQDPTHVSFWNRNSFKYFERGNVYRERFARSYGISAAFEVVKESIEQTLDGPKLRIVLSKVA
jgi:Methyltransferase domain/Glycosyl transferase family 2